MERALIYGLIFKVQNQLNLLEGKEVSPIRMTKSELLDATHISDYALNVYEASDADSAFHESSPDPLKKGSHHHDSVITTMNLGKEDKIIFSWFQQEEDTEGNK
jgi:hypothetical protein